MYFCAQVVEIQQGMMEASGFLEQAVQQCKSLSCWRTNLLDIAGQLEFQMEEMVSHCEASQKARVSLEVDLEGLRNQLEMLDTLKERLGQEKVEQVRWLLQVDRKLIDHVAAQ